MGLSNYLWANMSFITMFMEHIVQHRIGVATLNSGTLEGNQKGYASQLENSRKPFPIVLITENVADLRPIISFCSLIDFLLVLTSESHSHCYTAPIAVHSPLLLSLYTTIALGLQRFRGPVKRFLAQQTMSTNTSAFVSPGLNQKTRDFLNLLLKLINWSCQVCCGIFKYMGGLADVCR